MTQTQNTIEARTATMQSKVDRLLEEKMEMKKAYQDLKFSKTREDKQIELRIRYVHNAHALLC